MIATVLSLIVIGAICGALARLLLPGKQGIGWVATIAIGIVGAVIGNYIGEAISPDGTMHWILAVIVSIGLLFAYVSFVGRRGRSV
jgi:uncharacterized membrane protein YeaQ/YmgE (transglycosylase-associated protein family)